MCFDDNRFGFLAVVILKEREFVCACACVSVVLCEGVCVRVCKSVVVIIHSSSLQAHIRCVVAWPSGRRWWLHCRRRWP